MNARLLQITVTVASLLAVGVVVFGDFRRESPGPISRVHAQVEELENGSACKQCHGGWFSTMVKSCLECHPAIAEQFEQQKGLHGSLAAGKPRECARCHGEHHGESFALVNRLAFAQIGVPDRKAFDHEVIGFRMEGRHLELGCSQCHANAEVEVLAPGTHRFLGLSRECASCHDDPHEGRMQLSCTTCHGQRTFAVQTPQHHENHLPLVGPHAGVGCRECHAQTTAGHALEVQGGPQRGPARDCRDCHEAPHRQPFLDGVAAAAGMRPGAACVLCHEREHTEFALANGSVTAEQHAFTGFPLVAPHDRVDCTQCHSPALAGFGARHPGRSPERCADCHADVHGGQFAHSEIAANGCIDCHRRERWSPPAFGVEQHAYARLPLDGTHATTDCHRCHLRADDGAPRQFVGTPHRCERCHDDAHRGAFDAFAAELAGDARGICANCHRTTAFADEAAAGFDHARFTAFGLHGAHAQAECTACHRRADLPDATGRRFGRIHELHGVFAGCTTCHRDPHLGRFDGPHAPAAIEGRTGCERCHDTVSFRVLPQGFDHGAFTGFVLDGAHAEQACTACHARLPAIDASGRCWQAAKGKQCGDCHADVHQGQFERFGRVDCARCHNSTKNFTTLKFRHSLDSRFQLGIQHERVPCASCHKREKINGVLAVRYKPLPVECSACHGANGAPAPAPLGGRGR